VGQAALIPVPFLLINSRLNNDRGNLKLVVLVDTMSENMLGNFQSYSGICRGVMIFRNTGNLIQDCGTGGADSGPVFIN